jgi:hypothetical protein
MSLYIKREIDPSYKIKLENNNVIINYPLVIHTICI